MMIHETLCTVSVSLQSSVYVNRAHKRAVPLSNPITHIAVQRRLPPLTNERTERTHVRTTSARRSHTGF